MPTAEPTINDQLATLLRDTRRSWRNSNTVTSQNTGMLKGNACVPDILVVEQSVSPVVVEAEVMPSTTVESDAKARLGEQVRASGRTILSSLAVCYPERMRSKSGTPLKDELATATDLKVALFTGDGPESYVRWPHSGWILGGVSDLSVLVQSASVPPAVIEKAADQLVAGVSEAAGLMDEMAQSYSGALAKIGQELRQEDCNQTRRMAATILANAFVFQESLAGGPGDLAGVVSIEQLRGSAGGLSKAKVLEEWRKILKINYWPIFDIARRILEVIPTAQSKPLIEGLTATAEKLLENRLMHSHDLTGAVFQRLIADRKFLAAYYTRPSSAALLVGLALQPRRTPAGGSWAKAQDVKALRVADLACGTGTLLSTAYQLVGQLHEIAGGDAEALHPDMMATGLVGCDILPAAAHLTASMLSGIHPTVKYKSGSILTLAYGKQPDGSIALGSLDLLDPHGKLEIIAISAKALESMGQSEKDTWLSLPDAAFDLLTMNPPFTRATGQEGEKRGVPNPMFAAFSSSEEEQRLMSKATKELTAGTSAHGNAGEASIFLVLADRKLKPGGTLAMVMPLSLVQGEAWEDSRTFLAANYSNLILVSIAGARGDEMSFSADTGMGECLVVGRKAKAKKSRATFVVLKECPESPIMGASAATRIRQLLGGKKLRRLEDGPVGGTAVKFGDEVIGHVIDAPLPESGGWNISRVADLSLAQTAYQLTREGRLWLPGMNKSNAVSMLTDCVTAIGGCIGPYHSDINWQNADGSIRGPFEVSAVEGGRVPTYPVLWSHDAERERNMSFDGESEGLPRKGTTKEIQAVVDKKVEAIWASASHCHFNNNFQFNSQSTSMQFTPRKTIGGRAWISILLPSEAQEKALVLWANTSLGLLLHWWHANKQQAGRGNIGRTALETLPVLNVPALSATQLNGAVAIFDALCHSELLPAHKIDQDPIRRQLDERFALEVLELPALFTASGGPLELLRMKLAQEPSIRGAK